MVHNLYLAPESIQPGCRHAFADVTNIYTDNLGNLQLFKRWIHNPHSMRFHPHRALFEALAETASLLPCKLRIRKVVSHTGVHYNEAADATALNPSPDSQDPLEAMGYTRAETIQFKHNCTSTTGWLLRLHTARWPMPENLASLHGSGVPGRIESYDGVSIPLVKPAHIFAVTTYRHIQRVSQIPRIVKMMQLGRFTITSTTTRWPNLFLDSPLWSNSVTDAERRQWLKGTYGRFFCNNSPGHPQYSHSQPNMCPVCKQSITSFAHVHLECSHDLIHSLICDRHNAIVNTLTSAIRHGSKGGFLVRSDAGRPTPHPSNNRWTIHPSLTSAPLTLIPDIVQYVNVYSPSEISLAQKYHIRLLEVAFAADRDNKILEKTVKYLPLVSTLSLAGHDTTLSLLCSDVRVPVTHLDTNTFRTFGIEGANLHKTRKAIWLNSIQYMYKITLNWRQLEAQAAHAHHPRSRGGHIRPPPWGTSTRPSSYRHMSRGRPPD